MPETQVAVSSKKEQTSGMCSNLVNLTDTALNDTNESPPEEPVLTPLEWTSRVGAASLWGEEPRQHSALREAEGADGAEAGEKFPVMVMFCIFEGAGYRFVRSR